MAVISGILEKITYSNEESQFLVAKLQEEGKTGLTTIVGNFSGIHPGESLDLFGEWVYHKRFGEQFRVERFQITLPASLQGIRKYLSSGLIKGIGPVMADRIVDRFGSDTLETIEKRPQTLAEVDGVGPKRVALIVQAWSEHREIKEVMIFLQGHGVGAAYAAKIYKHYGTQAIPTVRENPYCLAQDIPGIGFLTADKIAQRLGIGVNSLIRVKAGLVYLLDETAGQGHVYYPERKLIEKAREMLKVEGNVLSDAMAGLAGEGKIFIENTGKGDRAYLRGRRRTRRSRPYHPVRSRSDQAGGGRMSSDKSIYDSSPA